MIRYAVCAHHVRRDSNKIRQNKCDPRIPHTCTPRQRCMFIYCTYYAWWLKILHIKLGFQKVCVFSSLLFSKQLNVIRVHHAQISLCMYKKKFAFYITLRSVCSQFSKNIFHASNNFAFYFDSVRFWLKRFSLGSIRGSEILIKKYTHSFWKSERARYFA